MSARAVDEGPVPLRVRVVRERGSASTLAVVLGGAVTVVALLVSTVGGAVVDQRRVASAADLAALAGAAAVQDGRDGCAAARSVADDNDARIRRCRVAGDEVVVEVVRPTSTALRRLLGREVVVSSRARAGPVRGSPGVPGARR